MNNNSSHSHIPIGNLRLRLLPLALALALAAGGAGCGADDQSTGDSAIHVVATTTVLGDIAGNVVGDAGTVEVLIPIGADPHAYQASARQAAALVEADLVITNGLGLEEGLTDVLDTAAGDGAVILEIGPLVDPLPFAEEAETDGEEDGHDHGSLDPHVWLDPLRMADAAGLIADRLEELRPEGPWSEQAATYAEALAQTDREIEQTLGVVADADRRLVTNHRAFGYFADRYGFEMIGTVIPGGSTMAEPSSSELADLAAQIEKTGVRAIFVEVGGSTGFAEALADEVGGVAVVELYTGSLGEPGSGADTLITMLLTNARRVAEALG